MVGDGSRSGRDDDLDWLYGRDSGSSMSRRPADSPEHTRVMSAEDLAEIQRAAAASGGSAGGRGAWTDAPPRPAAPPRARPQPGPPPAGAGYGGGGGGYAGGSGRPRRRRHPVRTFFSVLVLLIVAGLVWLVGVPLFAFSTTSKVDSAPSGDRPVDQPGTTYLLVGSDSREDLTAEEREELGTGGDAGQRTDTIMMLYVPPGGKPALISIPRDSYVSIPEHGQNKINAAYSFGGAPLLVQTVEQNTGIRVDRYVEIGFGGFVEIVDAVGGVELCPKDPIKDDKAHIDIPAGCQTLDGKTALGYARARYSDPKGDLGRVERQRQVVAAIAKKVATPMSVINPVRYWKLNHAGADAVAFGDDTGVLSMPTMGLAMMKISSNQGLTLTVPVSNPNFSTPAGSAVQWDEAKAEDMFTAIQRGDTAALEQFVEKE